MITEPGAALAAYEEFRQAHGELFDNPPNAAFQIILEQKLQREAGAGVMYRDGHYVLLRDAVRFRDGTVGPYIRLIPAGIKGGAAVLPLLDNAMVLIHHFRHATRRWHWEIPRGFTHADEPAEETARREVQEELGVPPSELTDLGSVHPDSGASNILTRLYLTRIPHLGRIEAGEGIDRVRMVTGTEFDTMTQEDQVTDSFTLAAVLQARVRGLLE